ncbi:MAG: AmmeMemoRadiSam system radical SAM enzyme [Dehalococcoidia bacterium]
MADVVPGDAPARHWQTLDDGRVRCEVCPRACRLREGQHGLCFVRAREGDRLVLRTYGRSSGFCIDPIEKKPLNHFLPGTPVLSFGTAGCNLVCRFCQNWDISKSQEARTLAVRATPEAVARAARAHGCRSVAFTYNDPTTWFEYAVDIAARCHALGIRTVSVTAGYMSPAARADFYAHVDAANVDLKSFRESFYRELCGGHLAPVLDTLGYLVHETDVWVEITCLLIPGHNDGDEELQAMTRWIDRELGPDVPLHFTAFHPDFRMREGPPTPPRALSRARRIGLENGLHYVYTGNVHDRGGNSTWCPGCGELVIERDWYELGAWNLTGEGTCRRCGAVIAGVLAGQPGNWGSRRRPVRIASFGEGQTAEGGARW